MTSGESTARKALPRRSPSAPSMGSRRESRRLVLLDAGIALLGGKDSPSVTTRNVLRIAGLTERYFYESFDNRDDFVRAVFKEAGDRALTAVVKAGIQAGGTTPTGVRAAIDAFIDLAESYPELIRTLLLAPIAEPGLSIPGRLFTQKFIDLAESQLHEIADSERRRIAAIGNIGATTALFIAYLEKSEDFGRDKLAEFCYGIAHVSLDHSTSAGLV